MSWWKRTLDKLRGAQSPPADASPRPTPDAATPAGDAARAGPGIAPDAGAFEASAARRDACWAAVGSVAPDVLSHLISPSLMGGPAWPTTRQAYRVVRRSGRILIATDGLSDPFDGVEGMGNGFETELFIETADLADAEDGGIAALAHTWAFEILKTVAATVAEAGGISGQLEDYGVLSMELPGVSGGTAAMQALPPAFVSDDDCVGLLIGLPADGIPSVIADMPLSPVRVAAVTLLRADELAAIRDGGAAERRRVADRLASMPGGHLSAFDRASVA
ncbi:hypothetical protein LDO32_06050 [Luteimonas sp. Y-2-2-4F]|nr:hypothetical protein [Luteimonas sp. Y-2-2-4F]MCD9031289.1 hypothetical protein [Luteimonas sp. Y-2-2-4F]